MENLNVPLVIRLSRTPKTNPRKNFCSKSLSTMGAKLVVFQHSTLGLVLGVLESLITRGAF